MAPKATLVYSGGLRPLPKAQHSPRALGATSLHRMHVCDPATHPFRLHFGLSSTTRSPTGRKNKGARFCGVGPVWRRAPQARPVSKDCARIAPVAPPARREAPSGLYKPRMRGSFRAIRVRLGNFSLARQRKLPANVSHPQVPKRARRVPTNQYPGRQLHRHTMQAAVCCQMSGRQAIPIISRSGKQVPELFEARPRLPRRDRLVPARRH